MYATNSLLYDWLISWFLNHHTEMAEGNGEIIEEMTTTKTDGNAEAERTEDYPKLVEYGLDKRVIILKQFNRFILIQNPFWISIQLFSILCLYKIS